MSEQRRLAALEQRQDLILTVLTRLETKVDALTGDMGDMTAVLAGIDSIIGYVLSGLIDLQSAVEGMEDALLTERGTDEE